MRVCKNKECGKTLIGKRSQAKFCTRKCRSKHWREQGHVTVDNKNAIVQSVEPTSRHLEGLNNVVVDKPKNISTDSRSNELMRSIVLLKKEIEQKEKLKNSYQSSFNRLSKEHKSLSEMDIHQNGVAITATTATLGLGVGISKGKYSWGAGLLGLGLGIIAGRIASNVTANNLESEIKNRKTTIIKQQQVLIKKSKQVIEELSMLYTNLTTKMRLLEISEKTVSQEGESEKTFSPRKTFSVPRKEPKTVNGIISSLDFMKMEFHSLDFQGSWLNFLGTPETTFHAVVHGRPGQGKSTFTLQFAKYLSRNFGYVLYLSSEEGLVKTMKDKFEMTNAAHKNLDIASFKSKEELFNKLEANIYHFIVIDSLNDLKMDIDDLKRFKEKHSNTAHIHICQSTKEGKLRGSQEIPHEADIVMKVENGMAILEKNRFGRIDFEYQIFK